MLSSLACPRDLTRLSPDRRGLRCELGHVYPVVDGIPVLLVPEVEQTHSFARRSLEIAEGDWMTWVREVRWTASETSRVHPYVQEMVGKTNGMLYQHLKGSLLEYPIPAMKMLPGNGSLLDVGCSWGRWSVAAARNGHRVVGIDPDIYGVMAARDIARQFQVDAEFIVADARYLPFEQGSFENCFSFSVLQHLSKADALAAISQIGRVLRNGGSSVVQMPNQNGIRSLFHRAKRGFSEGANFQVRYWAPAELTAAFERHIGPTELAVAGFFGLGVQMSDLRFMPLKFKLIIRLSEALGAAASVVEPLKLLADSLFVCSVRRENEVSVPLGGCAPHSTPSYETEGASSDHASIEAGP